LRRNTKYQQQHQQQESLNIFKQPYFHLGYVRKLSGPQCYLVLVAFGGFGVNLNFDLLGGFTQKVRQTAFPFGDAVGGEAYGLSYAFP
jgi:hypothetical protein